MDECDIKVFLSFDRERFHGEGSFMLTTVDPQINEFKSIKAFS